MILSAHQPNFLPWAPYFEKVSRSDVFVLLGHVQFQKNNYQNRFQHEGKWHTLRVRSGSCEIRQKAYVDSISDWRSIQASLPSFSNVFESLAPIISDNVWETNTAIIGKILDTLEIATIVEEDFPTQLRSTERLIEICSRFGADTYLSGPSGRTYLDLNKFQDAGIKVQFFESQNQRQASILERLEQCL